MSTMITSVEETMYRMLLSIGEKKHLRHSGAGVLITTRNSDTSSLASHTATDVRSFLIAAQYLPPELMAAILYPHSCEKTSCGLTMSMFVRVLCQLISCIRQMFTIIGCIEKCVKTMEPSTDVDAAKDRQKLIQLSRTLKHKDATTTLTDGRCLTKKQLMRIIFDGGCDASFWAYEAIEFASMFDKDEEMTVGDKVFADRLLFLASVCRNYFNAPPRRQQVMLDYGCHLFDIWKMMGDTEKLVCDGIEYSRREILRRSIGLLELRYPEAGFFLHQALFQYGLTMDVTETLPLIVNQKFNSFVYLEYEEREVENDAIERKETTKFGVLMRALDMVSNDSFDRCAITEERCLLTLAELFPDYVVSKIDGNYCMEIK